MSNTSNNKTANSKPTKSKDKDKLRVIVGEIGRDSKTGILGRGYSSDNGKTFHVTDTMYGRLYDPNDIEGIWNGGTADKVKKEVDSATAEIPAAVSAANSAVSAAESAVAASKVNSDAIVAQSEAISEAKSAMDSATAEIQQTAANAASDAAKIRADVAQVQNEVDTAKAANSASVEALKSDVSAAKQDLADVHDSLTKAQAAAEESQKTIDKSIAQINSDIEQDRKDIASAQQANADTAKQLDDYSKQAQDQGKTIKSIQDKQDGFTATLADVQGNVTQVSDKVDGLSAGLKDAQGNVASLKAQADQLSATLTDHGKNIATLTATAKELSSTLEDADGRLSKVEQTASEQATTLSDVQGDLSQVKQTADGLVTTLKDAQGNIDQIKQTAKGTAEQLSNAQGDITALQKDVDGIKLTIADHDKNIHTLQADSKSLQDDMEDAKGNISTLQKTSTSITSELKDHDGRMSKVEQTAATLTNEFADQQGHLNRVEQTATGTEQTVANQQGQINTIKTDTAGIHETLTGQGNQIANINVTLGGLNTKYEGVSGDLSNLSNKAMQNRGTVNSPDFNSLTQAGYYTVTLPINGKNYPTGSWGTLEVSGDISDANGRLNQKYVSDDNGTAYIRQYNASAKLWTAWVKEANQYDIDTLNGKITTNSTQITQNKQAIALKADQSTVGNLSGEVSRNSAQLKVQADQISSKVSSTDFKMLSDKVNNSKVGGRNLVRNTDTDIVIDDTGNTGTQGWRFAIINLTQQPKVGDQITVSAEGMLTGRGDLSAYEAILYDTSTTHARSWTVGLTPGKRSNATLTVTNLDGNGDTILLIYAGKIADTEGKKNVIHHLKVEFGNVATDWTPAPEDLTTAIQKNSTAIDQTNQKISLKADQTEVDQVKQTATQNSSRLDVMANEISSKVTSTDVNNIVDKKGYATTSTVQSLITQKAGTINESITNLESKFSSSSGINLAERTNQGTTNWMCDPGNGATNLTEININGVRGVRFNNTRKSTTWWVAKYVLNLDNFEPNEDYVISFDIRASTDVYTGAILSIAGGDSGHKYFTNNSFNQRLSTNDLTHVSLIKHTNWSLDKSNSESFYLNSISLGQCDWVDFVNLKIARGTIDKGYSPAPSDNATVTQVQQITASIDGLQSTVANKADKSQITQLSNMIQSKVSSSDFNDLRKAVDLQKLVSADINNMKTNGHYFVRNLANNPVGGWVYVDVTGNGADRIRQDVYQDNGNQHKYRRWFGDSWTAWSQGATESEITQLRDDINLRVKSGDLLSQINIQAGQTLIQSKKLYLADDSVIFSNKAFIPSAAIVNLDASKLTFYGSGGTYATMGSSVSQYDADKLKSTINLQYNGGVEVHASNELGSILTMHDDTIRLAVKSQVYGSGSGQALNQQYSGVWFGSNYTLMNTVDKEGKTTGWAIGSNKSGANNDYRAYLYDNSTSVQPNYGVGIGTTRFDVYAGNSQLFLGPDKAELRGSEHATLHGNTETFVEGGNEQIYMHDGEVNIGNPNNFGSNTSVHLTVAGWADFKGWVNAMGITQTSLLSTKTRLEPLNTAYALQKINEADVQTYQFKSDVADGRTKRHTSVVIDDVHDVAQYNTPEEFVSENRKGRDDGDIIGFLMGAVQELTKQLDKVKEKVNNE